MDNRYSYRFQVDGVYCHPNWADSTVKSYERENGRVFHREKLKGTLIFQREPDFYKLLYQNLDHKFELVIYRGVDGVYTKYIEGHFYKTDCFFDEDNKIAQVELTVVDRYEKLLTSLDKEYDIVRDIEPPIYTVKYIKQPVIQIAFDSHTTLFNLIGDSVYLKEIPPYLRADLDEFGFVSTSDDFGIGGYAFIPGEGDMTVDVAGLYEAFPIGYIRSDGNFRIHMADIGGGDVQWVIQGWGDFIGLGIVYRIPETAPTTVNMFETDIDRTMSGSKTFESETTDSVCKVFLVTPYVRILTDEEEVLGVDTLLISDIVTSQGEDIGGHQFGYTRYIDPASDVFFDDQPDVLQMLVLATDAHQTAPTQYGTFDAEALHFAGEYFTQIDVAVFPSQRRYPVIQLGWREYSLWGIKTPNLQTLLDDAVTTKYCRNAYKLQEVLKYLTHEIDSEITYNSTITHSRFFNSLTNPVTGDSNEFTHFITPKSNIKIGDYDNPAKRGLLKFVEIDQLLSGGVNCHWYLNRQKRMHIEHIEYFRRGKSYAGNSISHNLTTLLEPQNDLPWAYQTRNYRYKKEALPERIDFGWMDETSDAFNGYPLIMLSEFVQKGNIESKKIGSFTSDLDYIQAFPELISKDGWCIMACTEIDSVWTVQYEDLEIEGMDTLKLQNGFWSFWNLHDKFHRHNLPAQSLKLNNQQITASSVKRAKENTQVFPAPIEPDAMRLLTTLLGDAEIESMEVNLQSRSNSIKVLHDLDFDNPCPCSGEYLEASFHMDISPSIAVDTMIETFYLTSFIVDGVQYIETPIQIGDEANIQSISGNNWVTNVADTINELAVPGFTCPDPIESDFNLIEGSPASFLRIKFPACQLFEIILEGNNGGNKWTNEGHFLNLNGDDTYLNADNLEFAGLQYGFVWAEQPRFVESQQNCT